METSITQRFGNFIRTSATIKIITIAILILILLIPISFVSDLVDERDARSQSVISEINQLWGDTQYISAPYFIVPIKTFFKDEKGAVNEGRDYLYILPENLKIDGNLDTQKRYRGIYESVLYSTHLKINGTFNFFLPTTLGIDANNILWNEASFSIGISDMKGIKNSVKVNFDAKEYSCNSGVIATNISSSGIQAPIPIVLDNITHTFSFDLLLNGSQSLYFTPIGKKTDVNLHSKYSTPSFDGSFLPTSREINENGFSAKWSVLHLNRNYPQIWVGNNYSLVNLNAEPAVYEGTVVDANMPVSATTTVNQNDASTFGVKLLIANDIYQKSTRVVKYGLMFVLFTFFAFFFSEIITKNRFHPIQYLFVGFATIVFYLLLLALGEHLNFNLSYIISAFAVTILVTLYTQAVIKNRYFTITLFGMLLILYSYMYMVLQLEDYALLMGAIGLLAVLAIVMYITRKIDWYNIANEE